jgi:hypothetical protein
MSETTLTGADMRPPRVRISSRVNGDYLVNPPHMD